MISKRWNVWMAAAAAAYAGRHSFCNNTILFVCVCVKYAKTIHFNPCHSIHFNSIPVCLLDVTEVHFSSLSAWFLSHFHSHMRPYKYGRFCKRPILCNNCRFGATYNQQNALSMLAASMRLQFWIVQKSFIHRVATRQRQKKKHKMIKRFSIVKNARCRYHAAIMCVCVFFCFFYAPFRILQFWRLAGPFSFVHRNITI